MRLRVASLLYPGCALFEVAAAAGLLARSCCVETFTPDGAPHEASNGVRIVPRGDYQEASRAELACVLVPGGNPDSIIARDLATPCLVAAADRGAIVAGICAGGLVLARAGLLCGRRVTHAYTNAFASPDVIACTAPIWEATVYDGADVVVDGRFVTAQSWAHMEFAAVVARELGILTQDEAAAWLDSLRGPPQVAPAPGSGVAVFGAPSASLPCVPRPSVYALLRDGNGHLAVVRAPKGTYLPGGGVAPGESPEQAVRREVREECGLLVEVLREFARADEFVDAPAEGACFEKRSTFLEVLVTGTVPVSETDHVLQWLPPAFAASELTPRSHRWAVGWFG